MIVSSEADRSFGWKNVSGPSSIADYHARVSVIAEGQASSLTWTATYEAEGISNAEARHVVDGAIYRTLCLGRGPLLCSDSQNSVAPARMVSFDSQSVSSTPIHLRGYLRRPDAVGPLPAVVLLHGCNGSPASLDLNWGPRIAAWGYITLTVDSFGPRGLKNTCAGGPPSGHGT